MKIEEKIEELIEQALRSFGFAEPFGKFEVEHPVEESHGDYSSNVALKLYKEVEQISNNKGQWFNADRPNSVVFPNPKALAEKVREEILKQVQDDGIEWLRKDGVEVAGAGFVNFYLSKGFLLEELGKVLRQSGSSHLARSAQAFGSEAQARRDDELALESLASPSSGEYGKSEAGGGKKVVVEYSSPNIAKPFTIGHLRSTIIGDAVANILEFAGWKVYRDNHLGDWGTQFGKQIYAIKTWGDESEIDKAKRPVEKLVELYVKFHVEAEKDEGLNAKGREWFKKLEDGDEEARRLWQKCVDWSWKEFEAIYGRLGIKFTENGGRGYGESYFEEMMSGAIGELEEKGLLKESEGAKLVFFPESKKMAPLMIVKSDGASLYATRDLATDKFRLEQYGGDVVVINETGVEQSFYWRQLFEAEQMLGWYKKGQRVHIGHGHYRFADKKMSTRKGHVIWLEDVLDEAHSRAKNLMLTSGMQRAQFVKPFSDEHHDHMRRHHEAGKEDSEIEVDSWKVAVGALKWNDLKSSPERSVVFDWDQVLNMQGNSGPYVQYTFARAQSVLRKVGKSYKGLSLQGQSLKLNVEEMEVLRWVYRFPEVVERAAAEYAPHMVCNYLYELAGRFNTFYNMHSILGKGQRAKGKALGEEGGGGALSSKHFALREFRLALTAGVGEILKSGLGLLGIEAPEKM